MDEIDDTPVKRASGEGSVCARLLQFRRIIPNMVRDIGTGQLDREVRADIACKLRWIAWWLSPDPGWMPTTSGPRTVEAPRSGPATVAAGPIPGSPAATPHRHGQ